MRLEFVDSLSDPDKGRVDLGVELTEDTIIIKAGTFKLLSGEEYTLTEDESYQLSAPVGEGCLRGDLVKDASDEVRAMFYHVVESKDEFDYSASDITPLYGYIYVQAEGAGTLAEQRVLALRVVPPPELPGPDPEPETPDA